MKTLSEELEEAAAAADQELNLLKNKETVQKNLQMQVFLGFHVFLLNIGDTLFY